MSYKKDLRNFGTRVSCFGAVHDVKLIHDRGTGRPRGLGFVRMDDEAGGDVVVAALHGSDMGGRKL